jgi:hypothetical protein
LASRTERPAKQTTEETVAEDSNSHPIPQAVAAIATVILAILGLAHVVPNFLVAIATITFGAALLLHGASVLSEYARLARQAPPTAVSAMVGGSGLSAVLLAGAGGIVLGVLALLAISTTELTAIAVIAFGSALILSSNSALRMHFFKLAAARPDERTQHVASDMLAGELLSSSAGAFGLVGLAAIVLGILALAGFSAVVLVLIALLALGGVTVVNGINVGDALISAFQRA